MIHLKKSIAALLFFALLISTTTNTFGKAEDCWTFGKKTNLKTQKIGFNTVYLKDTTIKTKGFALFGAVLALNSTKEKPNENLSGLLDKGLFHTTITVTLVSPKGIAEDVVFNNTGLGSGNVVLAFSEKYKEWTCKDSCITIKFTNLCGQTNHFRPNYAIGANNGEGWQHVDAALIDISGGGCNTNYRVKGLNFTGSGITVTGGNLEFHNNSKVLISGSLKQSNTIITKVMYTLIGRDGKGNSARFEGEAFYNANTGNYELNVNGSKNFDNGFIVGETNCTIINFCKDTVILTGTYERTETDFAILLNGVNRPAKYGQCMVFAGKVADSSKAVRISGLTVNYTVVKDEKTGGYNVGALIGLQQNKDGRPSPIEAMIEWGMASFALEYVITDENRKTETRKGTIDKHLGALQHWHSDLFASGHQRSRRITSITLNVTNDCGNTYKLTAEYIEGFNVKDTPSTWTELWNVDQTFTDECESNIQLAYKSASSAHVGGVFSAQFEIAKKEKGDIAKSIVLNVEITNCKGEVKYIEVKMGYNEKSQSYTGSMGIPEDNSCKWAATDLKMTVYNQCGDVVSKGNYPTLITKMKDKIAKGDI